MSQLSSNLILATFEHRTFGEVFHSADTSVYTREHAARRALSDFETSESSIFSLRLSSSKSRKNLGTLPRQGYMNLRR